MAQSRWSDQERRYLRLAYRLARKAAGRTSPNPIVGAVLRVADRAYILQTGRVLMQGSAADIRVNPDVRKAYLGL